MNAVEHFVARLPAEAVRRLAALRSSRFAPDAPAPRRDLDADAARELVIARWGGDLCGLLNALTRGELATLARARDDARSPELRLRLWHHGAELERAGAELACGVQPRPVVLGGHLVIQAAPRGLYPASPAWPRPVPAPVAEAPPPDEPDTLDELLAAADRALGVPLGRRGRDKGAWGLRASALLGVRERGGDEPDWRGDVELKTIAIARERDGRWRVVEDPAIAMLGETEAMASRDVRPASRTAERRCGAIAKLQRTLWLARADLAGGDATLVSWYLLEWDAEIARLSRRYLHVRPKGPAGTSQRGLYLHKRFFADAGLLATLNGPS